MALFAICDVHGHLEPLKILLDNHEFSPNDTIVFLGDYVDKGPDVAGTLEFLTQISNQSNMVFLRGNHDQLLIDAYRDPTKIALWDCLAGDMPLNSYSNGPLERVLLEIPISHIDFLEKDCVDYYETDKFIMVHGGIQSHLSPSEDDTDHMHWLTLSAALPHFSGKTVICGHSSQDSGRIADLGHTICIDTGITKGLNITCLNLNDFSYKQCSADKQISKGILDRRLVGS